MVLTRCITPDASSYDPNTMYIPLQPISVIGYKAVFYKTQNKTKMVNITAADDTCIPEKTRLVVRLYHVKALLT